MYQSFTYSSYVVLLSHSFSLCMLLSSRLQILINKTLCTFNMYVIIIQVHYTHSYIHSANIGTESIVGTFIENIHTHIYIQKNSHIVRIYAQQTINGKYIYIVIGVPTIFVVRECVVYIFTTYTNI